MRAISPSPIQCLPRIPNHPLRGQRSAPPSNSAVSTTKALSGFGHTLLTALNSSPNPSNPILKPENQKGGKVSQGEGDEGREISGSDVLWALQRAAAAAEAEKKKVRMKNRKRKAVSSSSGGKREEDGGDLSNVKALCIKSDWSSRLDELEKRLQELSEIG